MTMPCEEIDLTCSQEEDFSNCSKKRKDVVNLIEISPTPKKSRSEPVHVSGNEGDKTNTNISREELKKLHRRIQALEEMPVQVHVAENTDNQYVSRQEFDHLTRRVTQIEKRVQNLEQIFASVKAALLFSPTTIERNSEAKVQSNNVTQSTVRRHSAEPQYQVPMAQSRGGNDETPQSSQQNNILETNSERNGLDTSSSSTPSTTAKPQKKTSVSNGFSSIVDHSQQPITPGLSVQTTKNRKTVSNVTSTPNSDLFHQAISNSSGRQINQNHQQKPTASAPSSSMHTSSARVQNGILESQEVSNQPLLQKKHIAAQRTSDMSGSITPTASSNSRCPSLGSKQTASSSSRPYDTPQRNPTQRPPLASQFQHRASLQDLSNQTVSNSATNKRNSAPSNSRSSSGSTQNNVYVGNEPASSSSSNQNLPVDQINAASRKQKKSSDYELPPAMLRNIRIKKEVESEDTSHWRAIGEPQFMRQSENFEVYIRGVGRKIRGQDTYVAVGGFSIIYRDRSNRPGQLKPVCVPFVTELNKDDYIGPKLWDKLKTEALIMAAEKAIRYLKEIKETTASSCLKVTIVASKNAKKLIHIMSYLQQPSLFSGIYSNANKCSCNTHPCIHRNRWDTNNNMINKFVCNYDLPKLWLVAAGSNCSWREEVAKDLEIFQGLKAEMDSQLSSQMNISGTAG
ncbi:Pneumococcal serine-rich repeat protein [Frankliniella fusca]|uniref:Pneumococcal serine-rich repeat protein n=1 Tax=Frankliniella fusca TaxID=407009 RepID=A0AAE1LT21_9NEOP|nr:Pneumococcal serine-rich repeat protein [Frankliniella fusca]